MYFKQINEYSEIGEDKCLQFFLLTKRLAKGNILLHTTSLICLRQASCLL